ncbi:MAG: Rpn family recombination-promoting nuclease/putative transposase [Spirochaetaceae bacterium]|jgi:predicted transposase/invertase (TIGR01784 family)|nr:Rpn family recombination-promoting nuclease/putative transposase [Spirochaetaceae bacterium]
MRVITTNEGKEILLPCNDYIFKLIFGDERNKAILKSFLTAVLDLPKEELEVTIINPELRIENEDDKLGILDVCLKTAQGKIIDIEIQILKSAAFFERMTFYKSKLIAGQIGKGEWYGMIKKTICIVITDFEFIESGMRERYHHKFRLHDPVDDAYFGDVEEVHTLELPKLPEEPDGSELWNWGVFLHPRRAEDLNMVVESGGDLRLAVDQLYELSESDKVRFRYEAREKVWRDEQARLAYWHQDGIQQGIAQGIQQGIQQGLQQGIRQGIQQGLQQGIQQERDALRKLLAEGFTAEQIMAHLS